MLAEKKLPMGAMKIQEELHQAIQAIEEQNRKDALSKAKEAAKKGNKDITEEELNAIEVPVDAEQQAIMIQMWSAVVDAITEKCLVDPAFDAMVMQPHKTLTCLMNVLHENAYHCRINSSMAMVKDELVYSWIYEYYKLDDYEDYLMKKKKEEDDFRKSVENKIKPKKKTTRKKKKKEETEITPKIAVNANIVETATNPLDGNSHVDSEGQLTLF